MRFSLLASLITTLGLVSVACAMPPPITQQSPQYTLTILDQNSPITSLSIDRYKVPHEVKTAVPQAITNFFLSETILHGLGYASPHRLSHPNIFLQALDPSCSKIMEERLGAKLPIYVRTLGGRQNLGKCYAQDSECLTIIGADSSGSPYGAVIETHTKELVAQVGNPAIVSFLNPQPQMDHTASPVTINRADIIAKHMVGWFFTEEEVWHKLGFPALPKILHTDSFPTNAAEYHFTVYGGTECSSAPCHGLVGLVLANGNPTNKYHGVVYHYDPHGSHQILAESTHAVVQLKEVNT